MLQKFGIVENHCDADGNPTGGRVAAMGLAITWQDGPLGRGDDRKEPNGAFVETVIKAALFRLKHYQNSKFECAENADAMDHLEQALEILNMRTQRREDAEVEGTHIGQ